MEEQNPGSPDFGAQSPVAQPYYAPAVAPGTVKILERTRPWVLFMSILGFVSVGFMILGGIGVAVAGIAAQRPEFAILAVLYPLLGLIYIFPSLYLYRYSARIRGLATNAQVQQLDSALDAQRSFWKFVGIVTVVGLAVTVLIFMFAIAAGVMAGVKSQRF